jgi:hypothetical protein
MPKANSNGGLIRCPIPILSSNYQKNAQNHSPTGGQFSVRPPCCCKYRTTSAATQTINTHEREREQRDRESCLRHHAPTPPRPRHPRRLSRHPRPSASLSLASSRVEPTATQIYGSMAGRGGKAQRRPPQQPQQEGSGREERKVRWSPQLHRDLDPDHVELRAVASSTSWGKATAPPPDRHGRSCPLLLEPHFRSSVGGSHRSKPDFSAHGDPFGQIGIKNGSPILISLPIMQCV